MSGARLLWCWVGLVVAVAGIAGFAASTASAARPKYVWQIKEGAEPEKELTEGNKKEIKANLESPEITISWTRKNVKIAIKCTTAKWKSETERVDIIGGAPGELGIAKGKGESLVLENCTVEEPSGCEVSGKKITTEKLTGELVSNPASEEAGWVLLESESTTFMPIVLEAGCGAARGTALIGGELLTELNPEKGVITALEFKLSSGLKEYLALGVMAARRIETLRERAPLCVIMPVTVTGKFSAKLVANVEFGFG